MSKQTNDRNTLIASLMQIWPEAKLGRVSNDDLLWLAEVATHLQPKNRDMSSTLNRYRQRYEDTAAYSGRLSKHNGDKIAKTLAGLSPEEVIACAERLLGLEEGELEERYASLNPGQRRMNAGNRIRAAIKRGDVDMAAFEQSLH